MIIIMLRIKIKWLINNLIGDYLQNSGIIIIIITFYFVERYVSIWKLHKQTKMYRLDVYSWICDIIMDLMSILS